MPPWRRALLLLILLVTAHPSTTMAQGEDEARRAYSAGQAAFAVGKYLEAADSFEKAYQISQRPQLLWNLATALRKQYDVDQNDSHLRRARTVYENFSGLASGKDLADARRELAAVDAILKRVDEEEKAEEARKAELVRKTEEARRVAAEKAALEKPLVAPPTTPAAPPTPVYRRWWLWTVVGVAVAAGAGVGLWYGLRPHDASPPAGMPHGEVTF